MSLPIDAILPALQQQLSANHQVILEAEPGAGKTTRVPLALLNSDWLATQTIIMLEPRRLAAKAAATYMARQLGEKAGETVGYRVRHETCISNQTRIEVVTEGILIRMLQSDPSLDGIGLVIFDEFHERSLDADLALALCLQGRELFREQSPLKLLMMSATLDGEGLGQLLNASRVQCPGRTFPVDNLYGNQSLSQNEVVPVVTKRVIQALREQDGSILVFLPGQKEIQQCQTLLGEYGELDTVDLFPLHGNLSLDKQQQAILPCAEGKRKVVLATSIAQTSLTIEGIRVVVDSGLSREARFDPNTGITRLHTRKATQAETVQRAGRAGRTAPGVCYRWWSLEEQHRLQEQNPPEILQADLSSLVLTLAHWGAESPKELTWMTTPPTGNWQQAVTLLETLGAIQSDPLNLTAIGENMADLPLSPRLSRLLLEGVAINQTSTATTLAALLSERDPLVTSQVELSLRVDWLTHGHAVPAKAVRSVFQKSERQLTSLLQNMSTDSITPPPSEQTMAHLLASAFPDRIGRKSNSDHQWTEYKLANGRMAKLPTDDSLSQRDWIVAAEISSQANSRVDVVRLATALDPTLFDSSLSHLVQENAVLEWPKHSDRLLSESQSRIGDIILKKTPSTLFDEDSAIAAVCQYIRLHGLGVLPWSDHCQNLRDRLSLLHQQDVNWPDTSDEHLLNTLESWLGPYLVQINHVKKLKKLAMGDILLNSMEWTQQQELKRLAPERLIVPSGSNIQINYQTNPPTLSVKLQEMFGCLDTPVVAGVPIKIELLSPAQRPLAVTQNLRSFWQDVYPQIKKEMKGRYPKHPWPEDPLQAAPTRKTNRGLSAENKSS